MPAVKKIVIVGGGSAGWLTAAIIAAEYFSPENNEIEVILIESPDVAPIGVGEGTWPSMKSTLERIGVNENDFIRSCDASFKQGSKFIGWTHGQQDCYYHPFTQPAHFTDINLVPHWYEFKHQIDFAHAVTSQASICDLGLAPKQIQTPEYAFVLNYGYHLDAGKFSVFLQQHCTQKLGVKHYLDHVEAVIPAINGDIRALHCREFGVIEGDLFIDCSGLKSLLIGQHYQIPFIDKAHVLPNDRALAIQAPYLDEQAPIASCTVSTAQKNGWIWDIGLPSRRGTGHVFSSAHTNSDTAYQNLVEYLSHQLERNLVEQLPCREINIRPGHRQLFWKNNCVAIGMAAGFIEPLEASALVMVELGAQYIAEHLPENRAVMDHIASRYNSKFSYHWQRIIDFLKLHYALTQRTDSEYWLDQTQTIPESLATSLEIWRYQAPWRSENIQIGELFPAASYQYVLYGMAFETQFSRQNNQNYRLASSKARRIFNDNQQQLNQFKQALLPNRQLINQIHQSEFKKFK